MRTHTACLLLCAACAPREAAIPAVDTTAPAPIAWAFDAPATWDDRIRLADDPAPGRHRSARFFNYLPRDTAVAPQALLGIVVYDSAAWSSVAAEPGPPHGDTITSAGGQVFVASLPQSNPFAADSPDARAFDSLRVDLPAVRRLFRVVP